MKECTPYYVLNGPTHHRTLGAPSLLLHPSLSLSPSPLLSVPHLISCFAFVSCVCFNIVFIVFIRMSFMCHFSSSSTVFFHVFHFLTCWDSCGQRSDYGWRRHFLCAGTCVCVLAVWLPFTLFHHRILCSWVLPPHYTVCV